MASMSSAESTMQRIERHKRTIVRISKNYFPGDIYRVIFEKREGVEPGWDIIIYNKDSPNSMNNGSSSNRDIACIVCETFDHDFTLLHIESLKQCGLNGTIHLRRLIGFSEECGFSRMTLEDGSQIAYTPIDDVTNTHYISLKHIQRLMTGSAWYEKFGFTNITIEAYRNRIKAYIGLRIGSIYPNELIYRIQDYASEVDQVIASDNTSDIMRNKTVSEAAYYLYKYLTIVCPQRICPPDDVISIVDDIDEIINEMYKRMLTSLGLEDRNFIRLERITSRPNQKGSSRKIQRTKKARKASHRRKRTYRHK